MPDIATLLAARETARLIGSDGARADGVPPAATFADLYAYARSADPVMPPRLARDLALRAELRDDLEALIRDLALYRADQVAAASSSDTVSQRRGPGFDLDLHTSRTGEGQVYILITLTDPDNAPSGLFVKPVTGGVMKIVLPPAVQGRLQAMVEPDDPVLAALRDPGSEVFLI